MSSLDNLKLYYFEGFQGNNAAGRGEYVRLLLEDAGVNFEYVRVGRDTWSKEKQKLIDQNIRGPSLPYIITADGKYYTKTFPLLRFISSQLGKYGGDNEDEYQVLDAHADRVADWIAKFRGPINYNNEKAAQVYKEEILPQTYKTWEGILSDNKGPYILGEKVSYADFALYHILEENDSKLIFDKAEYPFLATFVETVQNRPNIKKYITTDRK